jgi:hypothetical protein
VLLEGGTAVVGKSIDFGGPEVDEVRIEGTRQKRSTKEFDKKGRGRNPNRRNVPYGRSPGEIEGDRPN